MPKYISGHPTIILDNMTGAGSLVALNHIYEIAKPDGLTMGPGESRDLGVFETANPVQHQLGS